MFTDDYKETPYWWERTKPPVMEEGTLPQKTDILIIGSGYTGLQAALQTARAGRETLVIDAEHAGWGASSRNGGQVSTSIKPTYAELEKKYGRDLAIAILTEGKNSREYTEEFIRTEGIDCNFKCVGRFHAAHNSVSYEKLAKGITPQLPGLETEAYMVPRSEQRSELGSDSYYGGVVFPNHGSVDPAAYHRGLMNKALEAGVTIIPHCKALDLSCEKDGFAVKTARGVVQAKKALIATNGYSGSLSPWHRRRIIPIGSYIIATEALDPDLMNRLMPKDRIVSDTRRVVYYYRPSPDRSRVVFGGRVSLGETNPRKSAPKLHASLVRIFPELKETKISHSWMGFVAFTFNTLMNVGEQDGLFHAAGYCGSGAGMAGYLGMRIGQQMLGLKEGDTAFNHIKFETRPFYTKKPWFLAPSVMYYRMRDSINI
ncbi:MAG: FAD-binding oxidoreductase [Alphaproteobacteria bacterium]|nr:MAG: FAD-binding oxidoreductase [Alphaproteobacteria bacterium]